MSTVNTNEYDEVTADGNYVREITANGDTVWIPAQKITNGLIGNWFANHNYVDIPNTVYDLSSVKNDGTTISGTPDERTVPVDSIYFDETDTDRIDGSLAFSVNEITMSAWIKPNNSTDTRSPIIRPDRAYFQHYNNERLATYWYGWSNAGYHYSPVGSVPTGVWTHVAVTWDVTNGITFYVNGEATNTVSVTGPGDNIDLFIMGRENSSRRFDGEMYDVRLYDRPLSASEIRILAEDIRLGAAGGYWSFHNADTSGSTAIDRSGQDNDGSISTGVTTGQPGPVAESYNFTGSTGVNMGNPSADLTGDVTIAFWARPDNPSANRETIIDKAYGGEFTVNIESGTNGHQLRIYHGSAGGNSTPYDAANFNNVFTAGVWTHVIIQRDGDANTWSAWIDGSAHPSNPISMSEQPSSSTNPITVGYGYTGNPIDGNMSDVRIYNRQLSSDERLEIYNEGA